VAHKYDIVMHMELLNSKVDHDDYMCDHSTWAFKLAEVLDSPHFKILYDIYHMQIMEGDVINTMKNNLHHIGHVHTAGVPGRGIFDQSQELNYSGICQALFEAGYSGYIGHEFIPQKGADAKKILKEAIRICENNI
jgi:hydroxypyruvate isomerase